MDEKSLRNAIKTFVDDNKDDWVDGIVHQGYQRVFNTISVTRLTPPQGGYHINISTRQPTVHYQDSANSNVPVIDYVSYMVIIELADFILPQPSDETTYQTMVFDFLTVRDAIIGSLHSNLVTNNGVFTYSSARYYMDIDYGIQVNNSEEFIIEDLPIMYSSIEFRVKGC